MNTSDSPVAVIGAGPIGLITALGLVAHGVPVVVFEAGNELSAETRAGTILTRTLEVLDRYDALGPVLEASLRLDEIGEVDRATGKSTGSVLTSALVEARRGSRSSSTFRSTNWSRCSRRCWRPAPCGWDTGWWTSRSTTTA